MPRRRSPAQVQAELRRLQQKQRQAQQRARQAVRKYNREVDNHNRKVRKAVNDHNAAARKAKRDVDRYNAAVRSHNAQVRANRQRLQREIARLSSSSRTRTVRVTYRASVEQFRHSYGVLEDRATAEGWADSDIAAFSAAEAANSVATLNALLEDGASDATDDEVSELQATRIDGELADLDPDLDQRWRGALFALHPRNPDAARHFCTSAREMLSDILTTVAPTEEVLDDDPDCDRTDRGDLTRRTRIQFCLRRQSLASEGLADFVEEDIDNVLALFGEFNSGTHGSAGRFSLDQLRTLKTRVEDAILFVLHIAT